jgi:hypothetical protein
MSVSRPEANTELQEPERPGERPTSFHARSSETAPVQKGGVIMKKSFSFVLVAASLLLASGAKAQGLHVKANVPFDFTAGDTVYSAGSYDIEGALGTGSAVKLDSEMNKGFIMPHACSSAEPAKKTVLVFRRVGDEYFLYQIWTEGNTAGRELPAPKRETQLARNGEKSEEIIVAANIAK